MLRAIEVGALTLVACYMAAWGYNHIKPQPAYDISPVVSGHARYAPAAGDRLTGLPPSVEWARR